MAADGDAMYVDLAKRWARGTAILFAIGAVSGTVLSFELGLLWPEFMRFAGFIVGVPFSLEGFAFFTAAILLGLYLYGWDRVSPRAHLAAGVAVAASGAASVFLTATLSLAMAELRVPHISRQLLTSTWALPFHGATAFAALTAIWALWQRRWPLARIAAAAQVSLIVWGWAFVQYPYLIPPTQSIRDIAAPRVTLELLLWALAGGGLLLLPSLVYLFRTFSASRKQL